MGTQVGKEIDAMIKAVEGEGSLSTEAPTTEAPATEKPTTKAPSTDAPSTGAPTTSAPATEAPTTEAPIDERDKTIADLRKRLEEKEKAPTTTAPTTEAPLSLSAQDFIGDLDPDEITRDKEAFNKLLNTVYSRGITDARKVLGEGILRTIPDIVKANITIMTALKESSDQFYKDNKDLEPFKKVVATVFEEVAAQNPGKKYNEILEKVGPEARRRLELHKKAIADDNKGKPPRLPQKKGGVGDKREKPNTSPIQSEIDSMNKVIGR